MARRRKLTDAEREQRRAADRERLKQAAEQLLTSDGWQRWVRLRSRAGLARLSLSNQLLVALSRPDASFVAGFKACRDLGYCVRKGEKAIRIIAPMPIKERERATGEETGETITLFKGVSIFDAQQVEPLLAGEPKPLQPPTQPLTGGSHAHLIAPTIAFAESLGYTVSFEPIAGSAGGWCDTKAKQIVVDTNGPANARLGTLVHEAIHALGVNYQHYPRAQAEVIVDTTTLVVLVGLGLDVSGDTSPMSPAGAKTARWTPSPTSPSSSTTSPAASSPHSAPPETLKRRSRPDNPTGLARKLAQPWCDYARSSRGSRREVDGSADDRVSSQAGVSGDRAETLARRERRALWRSRGPPPMPVACVSIRRPPAERTNCGAPLERPAGQSKADRLSAFTRRSPAA